MKIFFAYIYMLLFLISLNHARGQTTCPQRFELAMKAYYSGQLRDVEILLSDCYESLDDIQQEQALRLLTISNLYLRELDKADSMMLLLLKFNPEYKSNVTDPPEFKNLMDTYKRIPLVSFGAMAGLNTGIYSLSQQYSIATNFTKANYNGMLGWQAGIPCSYHLNKNFWISMDLIFERRSFESEETYIDSLMNINSREIQYRFNIPITLKYVFSKWTYNPYFEAGMGMHILLNAQSRLIRTNTNTGIRVVDFEYPFSNSRETLNYSVLGGMGVIRKIKGGFLGLSFRYSYELLDQIKNDKLYIDNDLLFKYGFVDNAYQTQMFQLSIYYLHSFYRPKKMKK